MITYVVGCNLCTLVCPIHNKIEKHNPKEVYASWSLDNYDRKSSSSGGIASIFYSHFLNNKKSAVYGSSYDNNLQLKFSRATNLEEIIKFKTSKYSISYIGYTYKNIRLDLNNGLEVLFIGTPCQVAGLRSFLQKDYSNLLTIDLICHGVPSQIYLDDYVKSLNLPIVPDNLTFRGKKDFFFTLYKNQKEIYCKNSDEDNFYKAFLSGLFYRENCYSCEYANINRVADITIGDFWGLGKDIPFNHEKKDGVSVILINTNKGLKNFEGIKDRVFYEKRSLDEAVAGNDQLRHPTPKHKNHDLFMELYSKVGLKEALEKTLE